MILFFCAQIDDFHKKRKRDDQSMKLRRDLEKKADTIVKENRFWVDIIPDHEAHIMSEVIIYGSRYRTGV